MRIENGSTGLFDRDQNRAMAILPTAGRLAVIDIGSNSVRLVVYDGPRRAPFPICNEKAQCGLGRNMSPKGDLDPTAINAVLDTLARFRGLIDAYGNPPVLAVATAAVRAARNGREFVDQANKLGFQIEIIDGKREAYLAALGVISLQPDAVGIVGDMGGGSLELARVEDGRVSSTVSMPIGALALEQATRGRPGNTDKLVLEALRAAPWLHKSKVKTLYAVGGSWRALARLHMRLRNHPLPILHHYEMAAKDAIDLCEFAAMQSRESLQETPGISKKRVDALPYAARVLATVLRRQNAKKLIVSAGGVREGLIYELLSKEERRLDPLLAGARFIAAGLSPSPTYGAAAARVIKPLFRKSAQSESRIVDAACALIDVGAYFHPDMRGVQAYETALRAPFYAISHDERAILALSLYVRHEGRRAETDIDRAETLLSEDQEMFAVRLGLALRFVAAFAPKVTCAIEGCKLSFVDGVLQFTAPVARANMFQGLAEKRLDALARAFECAWSTEFIEP